MEKPIYPCLWFDGKAKEAAEFYCKVFSNSHIQDENPLVVTFLASGQKFMCLNGGPQFQITPSISFYTVLDSEEEIQGVWNLLIKDGSAMMPLDEYPWSKKYGWVKDKFGVTWQLTLDKPEHSDQKFIPCLMFSESNFGRAEEAIQHYLSIFENSNFVFAAKYGEEDKQQRGKIMHAQFFLQGILFAAMDSSLVHDFNFNEGLSLVLDCETQDEIDYFWEKLSEGGSTGQCGWIKDKYGVSWQVVPSNLGKLVSDPVKGQAVVKAFMKMKKFDMTVLEKAGT